MCIVVKSFTQNILNMKTRMPFRFGIVSMTEVPHLFLGAEMEVDGVRTKGMASEGLLPKWFVKDPSASHEDEIRDMFSVIQAACDAAVNLGACPTVFELWRWIYEEQKAWGDSHNIPGLLRNFGVSMVERAVIDGFCRAKNITLREALKNELLGMDPGWIHKELQGSKASQILTFDGVSPMYLRHTVGMTDYLREEEIPEPERLHDGLPQSLEACVREYGLKRLKIKLSGDIRNDVARLTAIAEIVREYDIRDYAFTLDGNENFEDAKDFAAFWEELARTSRLEKFFRRLIFVEQPIKRKTALSEATGEVFTRWEKKPPMIIDESDSELDSAERALECGYEGASHKNCKGIFKGIANACLLARRAEKNPGKTYLMSGEDLANIGPVALLQDLTVSSLLGITHIERNGHHYFRGLAMYPEKIREQVLSVHNDLYKRHRDGFPTLDIRDGKIRVDSLLNAPFGYGFDLDVSGFTPKEQWTYQSLHG